MDIVLYSGPEHGGEIVNRLLGSKYKIRISEATPQKLIPQFEQCMVFLDASMKVPITADDISRAKNLKLVVTATTGASHIDQGALKQRGIPLFTLKGQKELLRNLTPAAEHSWLLLMACARQLRSAIYHVEKCKWERIAFPGLMLKGKTIGIIGIGRIGSWMARYATAFGMKVQAYDPMVSCFPAGVKKVELDHLLSTSDFITIHVHMTPETTGMLNAEKIKLFKRGCVFINTSRAELVDINALVKGLHEGQIAAVGVDVLLDEPDIAKDPLWQCSKSHGNVIITPHIGGFCPEAVDRVIEFSAKRILEYFNEL